MGQYKCDQCNNGYTRIPNLNIHKKRVHDNISYSCDECNYNTNQKRTRKMHALSIVLPRQIRKDGLFYKMLKIEQMGESLHQKLNTLETRYASVWPKSKRYFLMLEELENSYYVK